MNAEIISAIQKIKNDFGKKEYVHITKLLTAANIRTVILKGPFLNEVCQIKKISHDLDILVEVSDLQNTWDILTRYYNPDFDSRLYINYCHRNDCKSHGVNHLAVLNPHSDTSRLAHPVELHFSIAPCYYGDFGEAAYQYNLKNFDVFTHVSEIEFGNDRVLVLNPTLQFWTLLLHYSSHFVTGLRDCVLKGTHIHPFIDLLNQIAKYWFLKHSDIDINTVLHWSLQWNRSTQTYLPLKLLNDLYNTQISLSDEFITHAEKLPNALGVDLTRKTLPRMLKLSSKCWTDDTIFPAFLEIYKSLMKTEKVIDYFDVRELLGLRYHQQQTDHLARGRITVSKDNDDELVLIFSGIRSQPCITDYQNHQCYEQERGIPGIYISFFEFSNQFVQKTYLCPFDQSQCNGAFLLYANQSKQYTEKVPCNYKITLLENDEYEVVLTISIKAFGILHGNIINFHASVGSFEPYFHMIDTYYTFEYNVYNEPTR